MAKLLVFQGSPRPNGFTAQVMDEVMRGAKESGAEVVFYNLNDSGVRGCQGCYYCRSHEGCSVKNDTLASMYREIQEGASVLLGSPIYFYQITGQAKMWLDRMFPMIDSAFQPRYPGRRAATVFAQGNADPTQNQGVVDEINGYLKSFGWELVDSFMAAGSTDPEYSVPQELMERAYRAGKMLAGETAHSECNGTKHSF